MPNKMRRVWTMISSRNFFPQKIRCAEFLCASFCKPLSGDPSGKILKLSSSQELNKR